MPKHLVAAGSTEIQDALQEWATKSLLDGKGDSAHDGRFYYVNGLDALLSAITKAARADGIDQQTLMKLYLRHARETSAG